MVIIKSIEINQENLESHSEKGIRLLDYLIEYFKLIPTRNGVKKALKAGSFHLNGIEGHGAQFLKVGDVIDYVDLKLKKPKHFPLVLEIVYEDDHMAVIYKPAGFPVSGNAYKTIENSLEGNLTDSTQFDKLPWPRPVHRLDIPTTGLLMVAKTKTAQVALGDMLENKKILKKYHAVVMGDLPYRFGMVDLEIEGRHASSEYKVLKTVPSLRSEVLSLVELHPYTGRTHQLRIHMQHLGCPILGDKTYGETGETLLTKGLFLSSIGLYMKHPVTSERMSIEVPEPAKFEKYMGGEAKRFEKYKGESK
jgi:23S rRNA pseudouridine1911/1915/1917 synthase